MSGMRDLPEKIVQFIESGVVAEFATLSATNLPIDTPTYYFPSDDLKTVDLATGLINPSKAERARRNPKVGMLMDGAAHEPVVSIRGLVTVRDTDFDANALRYISETGFRMLSPTMTWAEARKNVQYWTRVMMEVTPLRIFWWDTPAAMDGPPQVWNAPAGTVAPKSDPAPPGKPTPAMWPARPWQDVAADAVAKGRVPNLTVCDAAGYPMPIRVRAFAQVEEGFKLTLPRGVPWPYTGQATLSFEGHMIFAGTAVTDGASTLLKVERALPQNQASQSKTGVLHLGDDMRRIRQERLEAELKRRGKPIPYIPVEEPAPTRTAKLRQARIASGLPITGIQT